MRKTNGRYCVPCHNFSGSINLRVDSEGETGTIELEAAHDPVEGDQPYVVELMIACMYTGDDDAAVQEHEETTIKDQDGDLVVDDRESSTVTAAVSIQDGDTVSGFLSFKGKDKKKKRKKEKKVPKNLLQQHGPTCLQPGPPESVFRLMSREMGKIWTAQYKDCGREYARLG